MLAISGNLSAARASRVLTYMCPERSERRVKASAARLFWAQRAPSVAALIRKDPRTHPRRQRELYR
jgi:hypothetical protein